ncbi:MAG: biotin/lipoyl-binding protein [Alphaproteobacteria bacterium]|nr:biotin/lipoyl-binding protein [Alphaproteobacteria bacterium]
MRMTSALLGMFAAVGLWISGPAAFAAERPLGFAVSGVVAAVHVRAGDAVKAGDVLAALDAQPFEARKAAADAVQAAAKVILDTADLRLKQTQELFDALSTSAETVEQARTERARARIRFEDARRDARVAAWELDRAALKAPFAGTVRAVPGYPGMVVALDGGAPAVVVLDGE